MKTKVFSFRWNEVSTKEGTFKRLYESFSLKDGMKKVITFIQTAQKEGFEISGFSISCNSYMEVKSNIQLRTI